MHVRHSRLLSMQNHALHLFPYSCIHIPFFSQIRFHWLFSIAHLRDFSGSNIEKRMLKMLIHCACVNRVFLFNFQHVHCHAKFIYFVSRVAIDWNILHVNVKFLFNITVLFLWQCYVSHSHCQIFFDRRNLCNFNRSKKFSYTSCSGRKNFVNTFTSMFMRKF